VLLYCATLVVGQTGSLVLTVAFCPSVFTGKGATIQVDPSSGKFDILGTFDWPADIIGCPLIEDPTVTFDTPSGLLYMYFIDESLLVVVDVANAQIIGTSTPNDEFFTGFENMAYLGSESEGELRGVSGTVTSSGFCDDGCFVYGDLNTEGEYTQQQLVPFKAMMDDSHYLDAEGESFWIQGSYDLRDNPCAPEDSDMCLLNLDGTTGALNSATYTNWTIYKYGPMLNTGEMLTWMEGFDSLCKHPYNDFLFAKVDLSTATATPIACITQSVTVDMDEWIASFSLDGSLFATGSGDAETAYPQLLVFDTSTGATTLNSTLPGLAEALKTYQNLFVVWSVDWVN